MSLKRIARSAQQSRDSIATHPTILPIPLIAKDEITMWQEPHVVQYNTGAGYELHAAVPSNNTYVNFLRDTVTNDEAPSTASSAEFAGTGSSSEPPTSDAGSTDAWTNESNAAGDTTSTSATSTINPGSESDFLQLTNFGFSIPTANEIVGVEIDVEWQGQSSNILDGRYDIETGTSLSSGIQLIVGGSLTGDNDKANNQAATTKQVFTYGGSSDLWGTSLTPSDVNASNFGVSLVFHNTDGIFGGSAWDADVYRAEITVYYQTTSGLLVSQTAGALDLPNNRVDLDSADSIEWICAKGLKGVTNITSATPVIDTSSERTNASFTDLGASTFPMTFPITFDGPTVSVELSNDGGSTWVAANNGVETEFTTTGTELRIRWTSNADGLYWKTANDNGYEVPIIVQFNTN